MQPEILVVDDEKSIRFSLESFLSDEGYRVTTASDYEEALKIITNQEFDLIFADIILGKGKTGIDLLEQIHRKKLTCPIIMLTGYPNLDTASSAVRLGAFDYLAKPSKKELILHTAKMALKQKKIIDEKEKYRSNLEAIFRSVDDGIITIDENLKITGLNDAAKKICAITSKAVGESFENLSGEFKGKEIISALKKTISSKEPEKLYRMEWNNLAGQVVNVSINPLIGAQDKFSGAVMVIKDETHLLELERSLEVSNQFHNIIGNSSKMKEVYNFIEKLADVPSTVLITGESGTGKELVAEALHYKGLRKNKPLIKVNCSALPETLLESELFGHVKGSFTGAIKDKKGRFENASKGTIFLDEIGDITPALQLRLLRVLQEKEIERVGGTKPVKVDVRVVSATNRNILEMVEAGEFREDLYYRLNVIEVKLPALRERREDIPLLIDFFIKKFKKSLKKNIEALSKDVVKIFMQYPWPGNIRELEHSIEHLLADKKIITLNDLPKKMKDFTPVDHIEEEKVSVSKEREPVVGDEKEIILNALRKVRWNKTKAARLLCISRITLYRKMKKYNI